VGLLILRCRGDAAVAALPWRRRWGGAATEALPRKLRRGGAAEAALSRRCCDGEAIAATLPRQRWAPTLPRRHYRAVAVCRGGAAEAAAPAAAAAAAATTAAATVWWRVRAATAASWCSIAVTRGKGKASWWWLGHTAARRAWQWSGGPAVAGQITSRRVAAGASCGLCLLL